MTTNEDMRPFTLRVRLQPEHIDFLNRVFEGYDHLAVVTTVDSREAVIMLRGFGKQGPVKRVMKGLPFTTELLEDE